MTTKKPRTHSPELNQKLQNDSRGRKRALGLERIELWILPEDKPRARKFEKQSQGKAKGKSKG